MPALPREWPEAGIAPRARPGAPHWAREGADWPNRAFSRFFEAGGVRWHVQVAGQGPVLLLLHGTGAATHSWRDMLGPLAAHYTVVAPDLPGHGFTSMPPNRQMSLPGMAQGVAALLGRLGLAPEYCAGHSAGAAILVRMCVDGLIAPRVLVALNGALLPFGGAASSVFRPVARMIARNPLLPFIFAWRAADRSVVEGLLTRTGSTLDAAGVSYYARLARHSQHTGAALAMMGNWDLVSLIEDLPKLKVPLVLAVGEADGSIPPADALRIQALLPDSVIRRYPGLGHLAHEEQPATFVALLEEVCR
jgi:magnesium chelatase accessory protein